MSKIVAARRARRPSRSLLQGAKISTGSPCLVDSGPERARLNRQSARNAFLRGAIASARAKLDLFFGRADTDRVPCPEGVLVQAPCEESCARCGGTGGVAIVDLRSRYRELIAWLEGALA
jgi:hypothetical protein